MQGAVGDSIAEFDVKIIADHEKTMRDDEMKRARGSKKAYDSMRMFCDLLNNKKTMKQKRKAKGGKGRRSGKGKSNCVLPRNLARMRSRSPRRACLIN